jgi:hypothetical protein
MKIGMSCEQAANHRTRSRADENENGCFDVLYAEDYRQGRGARGRG